MPTKPEVLTDEHLEYLDELRDSGDTNMFGARSYLIAKFPEHSSRESVNILTYWMKTFSERHKDD